MIEHDSCLTKDQSGGVRNPPLPDDPGTDYGVEVASLADAAEEMLSAAVTAPRVARYYQGRACSAMKRSKADIDQVVIHTPEGGESGTLSVLNGTGASLTGSCRSRAACIAATTTSTMSPGRRATGRRTFEASA